MHKQNIIGWNSKWKNCVESVFIRRFLCTVGVRLTVCVVKVTQRYHHAIPPLCFPLSFMYDCHINSLDTHRRVFHSSNSWEKKQHCAPKGRSLCLDPMWCISFGFSMYWHLTESLQFKKFSRAEWMEILRVYDPRMRVKDNWLPLRMKPPLSIWTWKEEKSWQVDIERFEHELIFHLLTGTYDLAKLKIMMTTFVSVNTHISLMHNLMCL